MKCNILIYLDLQGDLQKVGSLLIQHTRVGPVTKLYLDDSWTDNPESFSFEPLFRINEEGYQIKRKHHLFFGSLGDSVPDRWGRKLIFRYNEKFRDIYKIHPGLAIEGNELFTIPDVTRLGALRFSTEIDGQFLMNFKLSTPPISELNKLINAVETIEKDKYNENAVQLLFEAGSSLGGARAKASVLDTDNNLSIAKFPEAEDKWPVIKWETVTLSLANLAGIEIPEYRLLQVQNKEVLILKRFDRNGKKRIPFISAMSMFGDYEPYYKTHSYLEIIDALRKYGSKPIQDAEQLFRRVTFNVLIGNIDDHTRNHGFLYDNFGWKLSPAYDMNPVPIPFSTRRRYQQLAINEWQVFGSINLILSTIKMYNIKINNAKSIVREVATAVSQWRNQAKKFGLSKKEVDFMAPAFEHEEMNAARKLS